MKIVDGGWEWRWRWRWRRKKQRSRTTVASNCKKKVVLSNNLLMSHSSMLYTNQRSKQDTGSNKQCVRVALLSEGSKSDKY